jgi:hypothetical protein
MGKMKKKIEDRLKSKIKQKLKTDKKGETTDVKD